MIRRVLALALVAALPLLGASACPGQDLNNGRVTGKFHVRPEKAPDGKEFWSVHCTNNRTGHVIAYRVTKVEYDRTNVGDRCDPTQR